ncbi:MAG TPA: HAD family hydrolase [Urbifossiella sp.]|jgi:HAD superfamily hydrolase (TIGR01509 family)
MKPLRGLLLDIDGTLVESNDAHAHAWVRALAEEGFTVPFETIRPLIGMGGDKLLPKVSGVDPESSQGKEITHRRQELFLDDYLPHLRPTRGTNELLQLLAKKKLRMAVASSAKKKELDPLLKICGADQVIKSKTSSDDAERSKPDPDIVHAALKEIGLPRSVVALLGDTPYDVEAGRKAGIRVIAVRCGGWSDVDLLADAIYDDPADLAQNLDWVVKELPSVAISL